MSKLTALGHFMRKVGAVAPAILMFTPLAPIAGITQAAIVEAEAIFGPGKGDEKLAHVIAVAKDAGAAINAQAGHEVVHVDAIEQTAKSAISAVISATKVPASSYHDPSPAPTPVNPEVLKPSDEPVTAEPVAPPTTAAPPTE